MSTPEGLVKQKVNKALATLGKDCYRFMPVQSGYGAKTLDYLLAIRGRFVAIETKAPGKALTPLQEITKTRIEEAGGIVLVVWDESSLEIAMKIILALEFAPHGTLPSSPRHDLGNAFRAAADTPEEGKGPRQQYVCKQFSPKEDD
jgi:glyoxylate utilization-related uncharacterized protein